MTSETVDKIIMTFWTFMYMTIAYCFLIYSVVHVVTKLTEENVPMNIWLFIAGMGSFFAIVFQLYSFQNREYVIAEKHTIITTDLREGKTYIEERFETDKMKKFDEVFKSNKN